MCGIAGFSGEGDEAVLSRMNNAVSHRGPDNRGGQLYQSRRLGSVGFAHARLSIIDLREEGNQPMSNEDDTLSIIFNGEIYNHKKLRNELRKRHVFKSGTDTEVILHLYEEIGEKAFEKIEGMFAIALYDKKRDVLVLARDRMGKKPLYWGVFGKIQKTCLFGSELKALIEHPLFERKISPIALNEYFFSEHIPTPHSIYEGVFKLEPATYLVWDGIHVRKEKFWKPDYTKFEGGYEEAVKKFDDVLGGAVKERMVSDVPLGIFLSGGIDSTTVAWYANQFSSSKIETFSIGFEDESFDESRYAEIAAKHIGTSHHNKIVTEKELLDVVPRLPYILDEPMADASIVPTAVLSEWTKQHVTVALGGDGGDELLYGYDTFLAQKMASVFSYIPEGVARGFNSVAAKIPTSFSNMSFDFKLKSFFRHLNEKNPVHRMELWLSAFAGEERKTLFTKVHIEDKMIFDQVDALFLDEKFSDEFDKLGRAYERLYMLDHILVKVDRASMYNALEVRAPLLSKDVVEFAHSLPTNYKLQGFTRKAILKDLMRRRLPEELVVRKKKGFGMPVAAWLNGPLKPLLTKYTEKSYLESQGIFNFEYVERIIKEHEEKRKDHRKKLWTLFVFQLWWEKWMK